MLIKTQYFCAGWAIVERGNHHELLEINESIYKKLTNLQKIA